ncbi:ROK family protein [Oscillospiraceae bacterium PP1C4]
MYVLGFDIGGTKCAVLLAKTTPQQITFIERQEMPTRGSWQEMLAQLCECAEGILQKYSIERQDCKIGISCGGPLDAAKGIILSPPNLHGWDEVPIVEYFQRQMGIPAKLKNDADACALAEWRYGAGRGSKNMVFLTFGTGLGAGLILNGQLYSGTNGMAGEVGHLRIEKDGPIGYGKRGSLEGFCSGGGIRQIAQSMAEKLHSEGKTASFAKGTEITAKEVALAAQQGNADALEVFSISGRYFGRGLSILIDILNPEVIVAGSIFARAGQFMLEEMTAELKKEALAPALAACKIVPAQLGEQIGDYAAVVAALE